MDINIDEEFKSLIPPVSDEEKEQLAANLLSDGCRDPLVVWKGTLLDGHNRYEICQEYGLEFQTIEIDLPDREAALNWIDANQLGRRNLAPDMMSLIRGRLYNRRKGSREDNLKQNLPKDQNDPSGGSTAETLADQYGVSAPTIKRDGQFANSVSAVEESVPDIQEKILSGEVSRKDVTEAAKDPDTAAEKLSNKQPACYSSNSVEWYTPQEYIEAAREVLGTITLDPASNNNANEVVRADVFFTKDDDGLEKAWYGTVFLNPPYGKQGGDSLAGLFCQKAISEHEVGNIESCIILVNSVHSQKWQSPLYDYPVCFVDHRIQFLSGDGAKNENPTFQNIFIYLGSDKDTFAKVFSRFGYVMEKINVG